MIYFRLLFEEQFRTLQTIRHILIWNAEIKAKFLNAFAEYYNRRKEIIKNLKMVLATLQEPFQPDDTELRTLEAELEGYIATHTNGFTDEYRKSMNALKNCSLNLTGQKLNMNQHRHDTNRFRISSKP